MKPTSYTTDTRREYRTLLVVNEYLNICVMKQNRKKKKKSFSPLFHQEGRQFRHHHFIFILFSVWHRVLESWNASRFGVFLGPGKKYPLVTTSSVAAAAAAVSSSSSSCVAFASLAEEEVPPPPRVVVVILRDHPSKKKK